MAHEGGKVVSPMHRPPSAPPPGAFLVLVSVRGRVNPQATVWLEGLSMTPLGIEPATFWLVAQCPT